MPGQDIRPGVSVTSMQQLELSVVAVPDPSLANELSDLLEGVARASGHPALDEQKRIALLRGASETADGTSGLIGVALARRAGHPDLVGCAPVTRTEQPPHYSVEVAVAPEVEDPRGTFDGLLHAAVGMVTGVGGGPLHLWIQEALPADDASAASQGFEPERDLFQMRCPLPLPNPRGPNGAGDTITTRPFRPGLDEEAWLVVNNRAFEGHPEQGGWELSTLLERESEPWFDPDGLLMLETEGRLAGSCWTKIHGSTQPPMGEIYVIGVDPEFHGRGWGRALTEAGLDWLAGRGLTTGMLYVDASNVAAVSMYRSMGFVVDHVDRSYIHLVD
jgi:mycothiol synthase